MNEKELHVPIEKNSIQVGKVTLKRSSTAHAKTLQKLDKIREQKKIITTTHKILEV